jgi:hypothetical protein
MNSQNLFRKLDLLRELAEVHQFLMSANKKGPLVLMETLMKADPSIMEGFIKEMEEKQERFKEIQAEWETLNLLESVGLEVEQ